MLAEVRQGNAPNWRQLWTAWVQRQANLRLTDTLLAASNSTVNLQWLLDHMGRERGLHSLRRSQHGIVRGSWLLELTWTRFFLFRKRPRMSSSGSAGQAPLY